MTPKNNKQKYVVVLSDGMAGWPLDQLDGKTTIEAADCPTMDRLAREGRAGIVQTVPAGMPPGSDVANLSIMGYDPQVAYTGRSPLEAISMGIDMKEGDVSYRVNLVTLENADRLEDATILDHSSDEITTAEAHELVAALQEGLDWGPSELYAGVSYRHCLLWRDGQTGTEFTPPHDITGKPVQGHLPQGDLGDRFRAWMQASYELLKDHPVNLARQEKGLRPANCAWFWGEGTKPNLDNFEQRYGKTGGVISAVDLLKGIGIGAGMVAPDVPGATGTLDTDYQGKLDAALAILGERDFVYIHLEGPDECGHQGNIDAKIEAISRVDQRILAPLMAAMDAKGWSYRILLAPDHATPIEVRTHTSEAIPFALYDSDHELTPHATAYSEAACRDTGLVVDPGHLLMAQLLDGDDHQ